MFYNRKPELTNKQKKFTKGKKAIALSLSADKWALYKVIILTVVEATFAGLLPLGQKMLLENPSIWTATWATLFSAAQVFFLMVFFNMNDTLGATMEKALNKRVFLQMKFMSKRYLNRVKNNNGQMHSSMTTSLVRNFGTNLFSALKSATIVSAQLIGIALSFGIGKYFWLTLLGLASMAGLVFFAYKWNKQFSKQRKMLDAQQNNRLEQYADQLDVHQAGTSGVMFELFEKVSKARVKLFRDSELKRALLIGAPRIVPQFVFMWLIYVLAISENRSVPELAMLSGFVTTTMMVSYTGFQLLLNIAESQGDIDHLDELMSSSDIENNRPRGDRPQGEHVIDRVETLSIQTDLRVTLPNGDTLFPDGLFPHHPQKKELLIQKGDCIVCVGTKGSGKSTLADILGRYSENLSTDRIQWTGKYQVNCHDVFETDLESFYLRVFYGTQTANHVDGMREDEENKTLPGTVRDNISLFLLRPELRLHLTPEEKEMWIKRAAAVVKLDKKLDQEVSTLSGGERALCMIGRGVLQMILGELDILILDEPFAHIDVATGKEMSEILSYLAKSYNCALLMINHVDTLNPPEATAYVFGESGKGIVEIGRVDVLRQSADSLYVHTLFEKTAQNTVIPQHRWDEIVAKTKIR